MPPNLTLEAASSIISIALSGKNLSFTYLADILTAASIPSSVISTLWWFSYSFLRPFNISIVSSMVGSSTTTGWKRLSNAASFSTYLRYSSIVVAPINWISPLAKEGFNILEASIAPSAPPAPIIVWISSINRRIFPASFTSAKIFLILSSNSPLYLEPATTPDKSRVTRRLFFTLSGKVPAIILDARPSAIAVLPTPGSPIRQGLFLPLLLNIWTTLAISFSLPITGSSCPFCANSVKSLLYWLRVGVSTLFFFLIGLPFWNSSLYKLPSSPMATNISTYIFCILTPSVFNNLAPTLSVSLIIAIRICSVPIKSELNLFASFALSSKILIALGV